MPGCSRPPDLTLAAGCQKLCLILVPSHKIAVATLGSQATPANLFCVAWWPHGGRCLPFWRSKPSCHFALPGPIPLFKTRLFTCGPGTWNGLGGCTRRRSRTFPHFSPVLLWSTRHSAPSQTALAALLVHASFRCVSCSESRACCGPPRAGCTASGQRCWRQDCSAPSPGRNSWAPWPLLTHWRCSCLPCPHGWACDLRAASPGHVPLFSSPPVSDRN